MNRWHIYEILKQNKIPSMDDLAEIERKSATEAKEGLLEWLTLLSRDEHYQRKSLVHKSTHDNRNLLNGRCIK
ncbi:hypothetical protein SDC9_59728 [bioreactor metagenome]|uniref:Uncharacterized protein n=1 Tax=bioreactor metagenome TaxID=1076179 RepID=A0A644XC89_9ZZZZ